MGTAAQKKKLTTTVGSRAAKNKLKEIWLRDHPDGNLNRVNKDFAKAHGIALFALCEIWHKVRSWDHTLDVVAQAFAEKITSANKKAQILEGIIHGQKEELYKKDKCILRLQARLQPGFTEPPNSTGDMGRDPVESISRDGS